MNDFGQKPIVRFIGPVEYVKRANTAYAIVSALDHPRLGEAVVRTSLIVEIIDANTEFHTMNSIYRRADL
jgi:hypothetical protein